MNIVSFCGIAVIGLTAVSVLRGLKAEYAMFAGIFTGVILLVGALTELVPVLRFVRELTEKTGFTLYLETILKAIGIGLLAQTTADFCRDSGESAIASKVEFAAKTVILLLAIPVLRSLMTRIAALIGGG